MNLEQMEYRCPDAQVVGNVKLEGYRLAFRGNGSGCGVATILPEPGSRVEGVMWQVTGEDERNLDSYEGYPRLYGKETIYVQDGQGENYEVMVYTMQPRHTRSVRQRHRRAICREFCKGVSKTDWQCVLCWRRCGGRRWNRLSPSNISRNPFSNRRAANPPRNDRKERCNETIFKAQCGDFLCVDAGRCGAAHHSICTG